MARQMQWTTNRALGATALVLGALAMSGQPMRGHVVTLDTQELAAIVQSDVDRVMPADLADRIVRGAADYRLIDVRDSSAFAQYHIPTAENIPIGELADAALARNEKIIVYADDLVRGAQAWMFLRAQGFRGAATLRGGLGAWRDEVVFPMAPAIATPESTAQFARALQLAQFFGGRGRAASGADAAPVLINAAPVAPNTTAAGPAPTKGGPAPAKKKKEGC